MPYLVRPSFLLRRPPVCFTMVWFPIRWSSKYNFFRITAPSVRKYDPLTSWDRVTHICVSKLTIIGLDNGLSLGRRQAIIWTNAGILLIAPLILIEITTFSLKKMHLKRSSGKYRPSCLGLNVLNSWAMQRFCFCCRLIQLFDSKQMINWWVKLEVKCVSTQMHRCYIYIYICRHVAYKILSMIYICI